MASGGPDHDSVARKIEEARKAVQRYREKESPVPLTERKETDRIERHDTSADGSLLGEGEALERLGADTHDSGTTAHQNPDAPARAEGTEAADDSDPPTSGD